MRESKSLDLEGQAAWQPWPEAEDGIHSAIPTPVGTPGQNSGPILDQAGAALLQAATGNAAAAESSRHRRNDKIVVAVPNPEVDTETLKTPVTASGPSVAA